MHHPLLPLLGEGLERLRPGPVQLHERLHDDRLVLALGEEISQPPERGAGSRAGCADEREGGKRKEGRKEGRKGRRNIKRGALSNTNQALFSVGAKKKMTRLSK